MPFWVVVLFGGGFDLSVTQVIDCNRNMGTGFLSREYQIDNSSMTVVLSDCTDPIHPFLETTVVLKNDKPPIIVPAGLVTKSQGHHVTVQRVLFDCVSSKLELYFP